MKTKEIIFQATQSYWSIPNQGRSQVIVTNHSANAFNIAQEFYNLGKSIVHSDFKFKHKTIKNSLDGSCNYIVAPADLTWYHFHLRRCFYGDPFYTELNPYVRVALNFLEQAMSYLSFDGSPTHGKKLSFVVNSGQEGFWLDNLNACVESAIAKNGGLGKVKKRASEFERPAKNSISNMKIKFRQLYKKQSFQVLRFELGYQVCNDVFILPLDYNRQKFQALTNENGAPNFFDEQFQQQKV